MRIFSRTNIAVAMSALALALAISMSPAAGHVTGSFSHLWNKHLKAKLGSPGKLNTASNPVHWTKLKGVPSGLADGADNGLHGLQVVTVDRTVTPGNGDYFSSAFIDVSCPAGKVAVTGGYNLGSSNTAVAVHKNGPSASGTMWQVYIYNGSGSNIATTAYAVCAKP